MPGTARLTQGGVKDAIRAAVDAVDGAMSTYRPESELSRFNRHGAEPFPVSAALLEVMSEAQRVADQTGGAFDITVGPLVDAWGFGPTPVDEPPSDDEIGALMKDVGMSLLEINLESRTLRKLHPGLRCDLSAIAKGYAVDRVSEALTDLGVADFMVEIERPETGRDGLWAAIGLTDEGMATSGDYRNYYERDGVRISHTIDPRTGRPVAHALASVTVIHPSCTTADALATALNVLGPEEGRALAERDGVAALFIVRNAGGDFEEWASARWRSRVENTDREAGVSRSGNG